MEYEQVETAEFTDKHKRLTFFGRVLLSFLVFGILCVGFTYWYLTTFHSVSSNLNDESTQQISDGKLRADLALVDSERISQVETNISEIISQVRSLEKNIIEKNNRAEKQRLEIDEATKLFNDFKLLRSSVEKQIQELEVGHADLHLEESAWLILESSILKAHRYLKHDKSLGKSLEELKNANLLVSFLPKNSNQAMSKLITESVTRLENVYRESELGLSEKFEKLGTLVRDLETVTYAIPSEKIEEPRERADFKVNSFWSIFENIKDLITVRKADHQLLNRYPASEGRLIKLNFQLETANARIAFLIKDARATQESIINLKKLAENYLEETSSLFKLIDELVIDGVSDTSQLEDDLDRLRYSVREHRFSRRRMD